MLCRFPWLTVWTDTLNSGDPRFSTIIWFLWNAVEASWVIFVKSVCTVNHTTRNNHVNRYYCQEKTFSYQRSRPFILFANQFVTWLFVTSRRTLLMFPNYATKLPDMKWAPHITEFFVGIQTVPSLFFLFRAVSHNARLFSSIGNLWNDNFIGIILWLEQPTTQHVLGMLRVLFSTYFKI